MMKEPTAHRKEEDFPKNKTLSRSLQTDIVTLSPDFVPSEWDVICQRGKDSFEHVGNQRFRKCIDDNIYVYMKATTRPTKSSIVKKIFDEVRANASRPLGGFVKKDLLSRRWFQISEKEARDKVGQALRDAIKLVRASPSGKRANVSNKIATKNAPSSAPKKKLRLETTSPQKPSVQESFSSIIEAHFERRAETSGINTRALLENQMNALVPFPISSTNVTKWDDFDASLSNSMLDVAIEPIDSAETDFASNDSRKRRRPASQSIHLACETRQEMISNPFLEDQMIMPKLGWQPDFGTADRSSSGSTLTRSTGGISSLRRLSLFGDQKLNAAPDCGQRGWNTMSNHLDTTANLNHLMNLPALEESQQSHQEVADFNMFSASNVGYSAHHHCSLWDLEPTPLSGPEIKTNHARTD